MVTSATTLSAHNAHRYHSKPIFSLLRTASSHQPGALFKRPQTYSALHHVFRLFMYVSLIPLSLIVNYFLIFFIRFYAINKRLGKTVPQLKALTIHNQSQISSHLLYIQEQIWTLPVNPSWRTGLSNNAQHCIWQKELHASKLSKCRTKPVERRPNCPAFHLIQEVKGFFHQTFVAFSVFNPPKAPSDPAIFLIVASASLASSSNLRCSASITWFRR